jgi:predicted transglutaminase-like cysteine proteinase
VSARFRALQCHFNRICLLVLLAAVCIYGTVADGRAAEGSSAPIRLFNTVEFRAPIKSLTQWLRVLEREQKEPGLTPDRVLPGRGKWGDLVAERKNASKMEILNWVNVFFNQWPYRTDMENYGVEDYWAAPIEFLKNSGDCEEFAIIKYFALKQFGFAPESMRIVIVRRTLFNDEHAVLAVYLDGDIYILDNLNQRVLSHKVLTNYVPQFSLNEQYRWNHFPVNK